MGGHREPVLEAPVHTSHSYWAKAISYQHGRVGPGSSQAPGPCALRASTVEGGCLPSSIHTWSPGICWEQMALVRTSGPGSEASLGE